MKVVIIGAKGNLGHQLMEVYSDLNPVGLARADLDITDEEAVMDKISELKPDLVFNCAAYNAVDKAEEHRIDAENVNGYAPGYLAKACGAVDAILVHYSSGMVFMGDNPAGYKEDDHVNPVNAYGRSKMQGELEVQQNTDHYYIIRTCWLFGKQGPGESTKKSFSDLMLDLAQKGEPLKIVDDEFGNPTYTLDLAQASRALVETERPFGIYHLANTGVASRLDWAREVFKNKGMDAKIEPVRGISMARLARRPTFEVLNNTKFIELRPWTEALKEYMK